MPQIQDGLDDREIALGRVGITELVHPVAIPVREDGHQTTEGTIALFVDLGPEARGAHMSRFVEVLGTDPLDLAPESLEATLGTLKDAMGASSARVEVECTLFVEREAPVSGRRSLLACPTIFEASLDDEFDLVRTIEVPVMTVCPCSKEASGDRAHSQRGHVAVSVRVHGRLWMEEIVELVDASASAPVYPLLKGEDEQSVIERAHDNPLFVEDLVRNVAERLDSDVRILWYTVEAENLDSVHDHNVFAMTERSH
jgi:GTP cyclohydrolase I